MLEIFRMFADMWYRFLQVLNGISLEIGGIYVSYLDVLIGFICIGAIVTLFWKGAVSK